MVIDQSHHSYIEGILVGNRYANKDQEALEKKIEFFKERIESRKSEFDEEISTLVLLLLTILLVIIVLILCVLFDLNPLGPMITVIVFLVLLGGDDSGY